MTYTVRVFKTEDLTDWDDHTFDDYETALSQIWGRGERGDDPVENSTRPIHWMQHIGLFGYRVYGPDGICIDGDTPEGRGEPMAHRDINTV